MTKVSQYHENLSSEEKRALLAQLLQKKASKSESVYSLSWGQQALWFLYQLEPQSNAYNIMYVASVHSDLDISALRSAFGTLIERHPCLRTTFMARDGKPVQKVHTHQKVDIEVIDASTWSDNHLNEQLATEADRPFDLEQGPVLRVHLFTRSRSEHIVLLTVHHIVSDLWSIEVLINELCVLYGAAKADVSALPLVAQQYANYVRWQTEMLAGSQGERLWTYWQKQLAGAIPVLNLPTDRPRPPVQTYDGASHTFKLNSQLVQQLRALTKTLGATLFMTFLAAYQVLLYRYTNQDDILVGSPTTGRSRAEFSGMVGYFVNPVVMRADFSKNPTLKEFLNQVRSTVLEALAHQDYPFPLLVERLCPTRDLNFSPLVQATFVWDKQRKEMGETPDEINRQKLDLKTIAGGPRGAAFDLTLIVFETGEQLSGSLQYNTDLFDALTIARMAEHFQSLLFGIVTNPDQPLSNLPLLTKRERQQLLFEWNDTLVDYPQDKCIHQFFEEQVEQTPDAVAVVFFDQILTYSQLNAQANQLAHYLRSQGVGPDVLVGLCLERSVEMVVALLGILKAGGAYVPLDPAYPSERLTFMLSDSQVSVLLTHTQLVEKLPEHQARVVCLDTESEAIASSCFENPVSEVLPDNLAYIMYTSGTTGRPKGISVGHQGVVRLVKETNYANLSAEEVFLQLAPISFDASTFEIWGCLLNGARLVVLPAHTPSLKELGQALRKYQVTTLWLTAGLFHLMVDEGLEDLKHIRQLLAGGDALSVSHVQKVVQELKGCQLINGYGPTENTTFTCCYRITDSSLVGNSVSIGRPIANTQVYLLDAQLQPVPVGVSGELYIGGDGLARGYLNRPDLTAEKFIPNPWGDQPGSRLYKTGDNARYLPDSNIEFLGRVDNQVKMRGFRIELGEIEAVLAQHPAVRETTVIVREDDPGNKRLVAYMVNQESAPAISELRQFLQQKLPDYMVPSVFVQLEALPLTPNGKVDRRTLPAPSTLSLELATAYVPPGTPTQELLADIWSSVLGVERVGIHDNFFDLGGHSLLATQVVSRLRDTLAVELPLRTLFESPTVAQLTERLEAAHRTQQGLHVPPLRPISRNEPLPLSFAQARLWFLEQFQPSHAYNIPAALRFQGGLDVGVLEGSLNEIVRRHEALRTTIVTQDGQPIQIIAPVCPLRLSIQDLRGLPKSQQSIEVQRLATHEAHFTFNLSTGPLLRATLLVLDAEEYVLLLVMHHIVSDGWSLGVFIRELAALYSALKSGKPSPLPELPIQYADFAHWQRQWLSGVGANAPTGKQSPASGNRNSGLSDRSPLQAQLTYWQEQLAGAPTMLALPTDRPRPAVQTFNGAKQTLALPTSVSAKLKTLSQQSGVSLFMTLLAAFQTLLYRYTQQRDICVGTPIANRNYSQIENLIGFFVNTLVLRTQLSGDMSFSELLLRVREVTLSAYAHQDLPFEQLVEALHLERTSSYQPLFQVMFVFQNAPMPELQLPGLNVSASEIDTTTAKFDLTLSMQDSAGELVGWLEYNTDLFDSATITRMLLHFQTLLEGVVANPNQRLADLPLLTQPERQQLLVKWNDTKIAYPQHKCIHQLFEEQVEQTPDAVAVVFEGQILTYSQLNAQANQLAHYLRRRLAACRQTSQGVEPDMLVGVYLERSVEMVVALLGILKAGGAYVPLDTAYPSERLAFMLSDSQVSVLLTKQHLVDILPQTSAKLVCLDSESGTINRLSQENPTNSVTADNLSYVIYTSGSTGKPKGVAVPHRAVNRLVFNTNYIKLEPSDRVAQASNASFDAATFEIWGALLHGVRLVILPKDVVLSPHDLATQIREQQISVMFLTTALFNQIASVVPQAFSSMRNLLFGGEAVDPKSVQQVLRNSTLERLLHVYGPTESTTFSSWHLVQDVLEGATNLPIGRPISNTQIYLLDDHLQPVPIGVIGELYVGGDGLAQGYLNRPDLTAEKFIPNPWGDQPGSRLYKTGDNARYLPDSNIEFLGRVDNQVKMRGFRIELGEIEAVLAQHPAVREVAVIAREDDPGNKRLVAYIVNQESAPAISELRQFLQQKLPDYMVPSAFVQLEALPLTPNGKVDRRSLKAPDTLSLELATAYVPPVTPTQELLADIWSSILGVERVGIHDNFFELGGHSLLATQVVSRLRDTFAAELPLRALFESPTVAQLTERLEAAHRTQQGLHVPPLQPIERGVQLPLSFAQARLWFLEQFQPSNAYNIPAAVRFEGTLDLGVLEGSLNEIVRRHEALRTTIVTQDGQPIQIIAPALPLRLSIQDLRGLPKSQQSLEVQRLANTEAQWSFDLSTGSLLRATLLVLDAEEHVLLLVMHHIVSDGWSLGVFIRELATLYSALKSGKPSPLPALPIQYADFAYWQRQWLSGVGAGRSPLQAQLAYWQEQLAGAPAMLELPTDRPRPAVQTFNGAKQTLALPTSVSAKLKTLSQQSGVSLFMTLLAAFQTLLYHYTQQRDICVGTPIANRNYSQIENLIGFFVNTLVLRTQLSGDMSFSELLLRVREFTLSAYAHQDLPFEQLVEALQPERSLSHQPLFQVMFVLQNAPLAELQLSGLSASVLEIDTTTAKFDLTLSMQDSAGELVGWLEYNTDLFDSATITRMLLHFQTLLEGVVANPNQRLADLPLLTQPERQQLLVKWNDTKIAYPQHKCIHQLFEEQVEQTPDAVAVVFEGQILTYSQLNAQANQLAHYLRRRLAACRQTSQGIEPDILVGVYLERSVEMVVALLGILKAGGAYVPLDTAYPSERLAFMLSDSQVSVLLTKQHLVDILPQTSAKLVCLDSESGTINRLSQENPTNSVTADNLSYVIYTSGSTGKPKGVAVPHRAVNRLVFNTNYIKLEPSDRVAQASNASFDAATFEIWGALLHGVRLVILPKDVVLSPHDLATQIREQQISVMFLTTALFNQIASVVPQAFSSMRNLLFGGEAVDPKSVQQVLRNSTLERLLHVYGPTESTTFSSWHLVQDVLEGATNLPIGRPISNTQIYLLDDHLQPVPIGVIGELYVGGDGLAQGYLNRPDLTAEKFIPNPWGDQPGSRLYKTGDNARYLPDSNIEFLGRVDNQVKMRGFRIELGEIEAVLAQHPAVQETTVIAREDDPGNKRLVAYMVNQESAPAISELRQFLQQKLPEYMIPSAFVQLEALPLTPNGKVDRRALPAPDTLNSELAAAYLAPRDALELQLAQIWEEVLDVHPVGVRDNFFDLGGHSLLAVRLMTKIQQQFEKHLPLATLFQGATIEQLASILQKDSDSMLWEPLVTIQPCGSKRTFFCVPGVGGNVIYFYNFARHLGLDQPFYALQARGLDGEQAPHTRIEDMAADYIKALQTIQPQGPYLLGGHSFGGLIAFEMALQLLHQGQQVDLLAILDVSALVLSNKLAEDDSDDTKYLLKLVDVIERTVGKSLSVSEDELQPLEPDEQLNYLLERLKMLNILPPEAKLPQLRGLLEVFKTNLQIHYVPQWVYPNQITLFRASEQQSCDEPAMGWDKFSSQPIEIYNVPGNHNTMFTSPHVQVLAEQLRACLNKVSAND